MGTRSLTVFCEENGTEICVLYRQYDGYPRGHGKDLYNALHDAVMVNGYSTSNMHQVNGANDLPVQIISHLKAEDSSRSVLEPGGFYLHPAGTRNCGEDFIYTLIPKEKDIFMHVAAYGEEIFYGNIKAFDAEEVEAKVYE